MNTESIEPLVSVQLSPIKKQLNTAFDYFNEIVAIYQSTVDKNTDISNKLTQLKEKYNDLIKTNTNKVFLFCLNSLYFQYKILNFELENFTKINSLIQNRMYGDYYKLYNIILSQCKDNNILFSEEDFSDSARMMDETPNDTVAASETIVTDNSSNQTENDNKNNLSEISFPVYKDVDAFFRYRIEDIVLIHQRILIIIHKLDDIYIQKEANIHDHKNNIYVGYSLSIFLNTLEYENEILKGQINLYMEYISFYHSSQKTYLNNLLKKNTDFMSELDSNILVNMVSLNHTTIMAEPEPSTDSENDQAVIDGGDDVTSDVDVIPRESILTSEGSWNQEEGRSTKKLDSHDKSHDPSLRSTIQENLQGMDTLLHYDSLEQVDDYLLEETIQETEQQEVNTENVSELELVNESDSLDENPCGNVIIDNLSYNMLNAWHGTV